MAEPEKAGSLHRPAAGGWQHILVIVLRWFAAAALFLMMVITFVDVVGRFFNAPIFGSAEMVQYLLAIVVFSGLGLATVAGSNIRVDILDAFLDRRLGDRVRSRILWAFHVTGIGLIAWQLMEIAVEGIRSGRRSIVLEWPEGWFILLGAAFVVIALILEVTGYREPRDPSDTQEETI